MTFTAPNLNSANKYVIRLTEGTQFHQVNVQAQLKYTTSNGANQVKYVDSRESLSPLGANKPGFKFYANSAGTWTANFRLASTPAPTVTEYKFSLYSVSGNNLNS